MEELTFVYLQGNVERDLTADEWERLLDIHQLLDQAGFGNVTVEGSGRSVGLSFSLEP
jgi:hypothetical protein